jgi:hypothetical protein
MRGADYCAAEVATTRDGCMLAQPVPPAPTATPTPGSSEAAAPAVRVVAPSPESAQNLSQSMPIDPGLMVQTGPAPDGKKETGKAELVVAPIPMLDPACGYGLGAQRHPPSRRRRRSTRRRRRP